MKIYENIKPDENTRISKLFGITIYKQTYNKKTTERFQNFLGEFITTYKISDVYGYHIEKNIEILGIPFMKRCEDGSNKIWYIANKQIKKVSLLNIFKDKYSKYFDKKHDHIYILNANSGEAYLFLTYVLDAFWKKNNSKNPLIVATKKYHIEMIELICPEVPHIYIDGISHHIKGDKFTIDHQTFYMLFSSEHFMQTEIDIKNNPVNTVHYFNSLLNRLNIDQSEVSMRSIKPSLSSEQSMLNKIDKTGLNIDKFVFIAPEAKSCKVLSDTFWIDLINSIQSKGFDIFVNIADKIEDNSVNLNNIQYKSCFLTYSEVFALAQKAKRIISLRSGLSEFLLQTNVPMDIIYTKFRKRQVFNDMSVEQVFSGFNISKLPYVNSENINEIIVDAQSQKENIEKIIEGLCSDRMCKK